MSVDLPASTWPSTTRCSRDLPLASTPSRALASSHALARSLSGLYSDSGRRLRCNSRIFLVHCVGIGWLPADMAAWVHCHDNGLHG